MITMTIKTIRLILMITEAMIMIIITVLSILIAITINIMCIPTIITFIATTSSADNDDDNENDGSRRYTDVNDDVVIQSSLGGSSLRLVRLNPINIKTLPSTTTMTTTNIRTYDSS